MASRTPPVQPSLTRLQQRLGIGLFLEVWPAWTGAALVVAGTVALVCRMFVPAAAPFLPWLWLVPVITAIPVFVICVRRAYRPEQVAAIADWLSGGQGILVTLFETPDPAWAESPLAANASRFQLPAIKLRPALSLLIPAALFLLVAMLLPQRVPSQVANGVLAQEIASSLTSALVELKKQDLITPEEEEKLQEEVEKIERSAEKRVDASAWEAADAVREKMVAGISEKQNAVKWAQESLARFAAAMQAGGPGDAKSMTASAELMKALEKLAQSGMLAGAPPELMGMLKSGKMPADAAALANLMAAIAGQLQKSDTKIAGLGNLGGAFGRFNAEEFAISNDRGPDGDGDPGAGGLNRGRGDADLTWGQETKRIDKFKSTPLPPGAPRSPDDWAPVVVLPGAPQESAALSEQSAGRSYEAAAGQGAWRRSLAPRHQTAVKKYFDTTQPKKSGGGR